jgi:hypothetical protein
MFLSKWQLPMLGFTAEKRKFAGIRHVNYREEVFKLLKL